MKELSIEQKAKRYDEAINIIRNLVKAGLIYEDAAIQVFPELKESEDKKIVKELLTFFRESIHGGHILTNKEYDSWIAWLEKQGEHQYFNDNFPSFDEAQGTVIVEKQGKQNPADKVEPKFHEGEWIVNNDNGYVYQITKIRDDEYCLWPLDAEIMGYLRIIDVDNDYHLWTIQNAKDGDVLVHNDCTFIFMGIKDGIVRALEENFLDGTNPVSFGESDKDNDYHPATKEERDLLFQKMKEAGYKWNAEKKELKKIVQIQVIDYPDNLPKDNWELVHEVVNKFGRIPKDEDELNALVEYVLKRQKTAWSEEDGDIRDNIIRDLKRLSGDMVSPNQTYQKEIQWLKSLRPQLQWKPSDEQM